MPFKHDSSDELKETLKELYRRDRKRYEITLKKMEEVISRDADTIDFYKNMKHGLSDLKRVHIDKHFVLLFKVYKQQNFILFARLEHHDTAFQR